MGFAPEHAGPHDPVRTTPPRAAGSVRRTTTIDTTRPDGLDAATVRIDARARDLATTRDGDAVELDVVGIELGVEQPFKLIAAIEATPEAGELGGLVGQRVAAGFRAAAAEAVDDPDGAGSLTYLLLDDLPGALLVSGFSIQHHDTVTGGDRVSAGAREHPEIILAQADICAGWGGDSVMLTTFRDTGVIMTPLGPASPTLEPADDPVAWHDAAPLGPHAMRRRRRIDLGPVEPDGTSAVETHFRDSHVDGDGHETVVHEYLVRGRYDHERGVLVEVAAQARVLPWFECPGALASAARVVGVPVGELRSTIRTELVGLSTCTHLNDTLRSLASLAPMAERRG